MRGREQGLKFLLSCSTIVLHPVPEPMAILEEGMGKSSGSGLTLLENSDTSILDFGRYGDSFLNLCNELARRQMAE